MNKIKRHLPGYIEHTEKDLVEVEFLTKDELLNIEWIKRWKTGPTGEHFVQYSVDRPTAETIMRAKRMQRQYHFLLMVELTTGPAILGMMTEDVPELPCFIDVKLTATK